MKRKGIAMNKNIQDIINNLKKENKLNTAIQLATGLRNLLKSFDPKLKLAIDSLDMDQLIIQLKEGK